MFPGPGTYPIEKVSMDSHGIYHLSKFKSSGATKFNPPREDKPLGNFVPGVGT